MSIKGQFENDLMEFLRDAKQRSSAKVSATSIGVKKQTPTESLLRELHGKIEEAEAEFEAKTLEQSQKAEKGKVTTKYFRKKALETLAETKNENKKEKK